MRRGYTTAEVSALTGLSARAVQKHAERNRIGTKHGRDWFFTEEDVAAIRERMGKFGRPRS